MKPLIAIFLCVTAAFCFAGEEPKILASSEWSQPVSTPSGQTLRARMIVAQGHSPAHAGASPETMLYLELQNVTAAVGDPLRLYFDPVKGLRCELRDSTGKAVGGGGFGNGGRPGADWISLPYDSTVRLRASMYGHGRAPGDGLTLTVAPDASWTIPPGDTKEYHLTGILTVDREPKDIPKNASEARAVWSGTLVLPKTKLSVAKP
jgi:hypothetical protein